MPPGPDSAKEPQSLDTAFADRRPEGATLARGRADLRRGYSHCPGGGDNALADIRSDIGGVTIPRDPLVETPSKRPPRMFSNINGLPGSGKSVVIKRYVERATTKAGSCSSIRTGFKGRRGALRQRPRSPPSVRIRNPGRDRRERDAILFIDGIDQIKQEQRGIVSDLLHAIESEPALSTGACSSPRAIRASRFYDRGFHPAFMPEPASATWR